MQRPLGPALVVDWWPRVKALLGERLDCRHPTEEYDGIVEGWGAIHLGLRYALLIFHARLGIALRVQRSSVTGHWSYDRITSPVPAKPIPRGATFRTTACGMATSPDELVRKLDEFFEQHAQAMGRGRA